MSLPERISFPTVMQVMRVWEMWGRTFCFTHERAFDGFVMGGTFSLLIETMKFMSEL